MATSDLSAQDLAYYATEAANVSNTAAIGQLENTNAQAGADDTYSQKIAALQEQLGQEQATLPDKFAARGIQNSGIYNYGGGNLEYDGNAENGGYQRMSGMAGNQLGAKQQFAADAATSNSDLTNDQQNVDQGYGLKSSDLANSANDQQQSIIATSAAQNADQATADAIGSAGA